MQLVHLKYFADIAELGSISAAALENFITCQGMSRALSALETELGCTLFDRKANGISLSSYGRAILPRVKQMLALQDEIVLDIAEVRSRGAAAGDATVVAYFNNVAFDSAFFGPLSNSFNSIFPKVRYRQCDNRQIIDALLEKKNCSDCVDFGLLCFFSPFEEENQRQVDRLEEGGFQYQPYILSYDMALVSCASELAKKVSLSRADMVSHPIVTSGGDICMVVEKLFGENVVSMVTNDSAFRFRVVAQTDAITVVPAFYQLLRGSGAIGLDGVTAVPMKNPYYLEIGFAMRKEELQSPYMQMFFEKLNTCYAQYADSPYMTLVSSDLTAFRSECETVEFDQRVLLAIGDRYGISPREREVFEYVIDGLTAGPIAKRLYLSVATVKSHIYSIYKKLGVHSQTELIVRVREEMQAGH